MPQTKVEKKFFRVRVDKFRQNPGVLIGEKLAVAKFQPLNPILVVKSLRDKFKIKNYQFKIGLYPKLINSQLFFLFWHFEFGILNSKKVKRDTIPVSSSNAVRRGGSDA